MYRYIKNEIIAGRIDYGVKLPSKRKLADYLKISLNTVETAYEQLIAEGYIKSVPRKGYFVLAYEELDILNLDHEIVHFDEDEKVQIQYNFHPSWIDTENFPFAKWRKYAKEIMVKNIKHCYYMATHRENIVYVVKLLIIYINREGSHVLQNRLLSGQELKHYS